MPTNYFTSSNRTGFRFSLLCIAAALITYMSMYAFRKPLSAATFEGLTYWGMDYKIIAIISQVIGYTCSKFLGIKIVSSMQPGQRTRYILALVGIAWTALFFFAWTPKPYNVVFLIINGLPLGMIFGIVISFLEGRKNTELLGAGLCISFITASGIVKSVGQYFIVHWGVSDSWMPFLVGLIFIPFLLLGVWMLGKIPPPDEEDKALRSERAPMTKRERRKFFRDFSWGVAMSVLTYATLTVYRDLRDNFAVELWAQMGYGGKSGILAFSEICIAVLVLVFIASMIRVKDNRKAFYGNIGFLICSGVLLFVTTWLFSAHRLSPILWMILSGFGLYLCYACFHTMFFERWIALFRYSSNLGFLICLSDSFGYLGSVGVLVYKNFFNYHVDWLDFIKAAAYVSGTIITVLSIGLFFYFRHKEKAIRPCRRGSDPLHFSSDDYSHLNLTYTQASPVKQDVGQ